MSIIQWHFQLDWSLALIPDQIRSDYYQLYCREQKKRKLLNFYQKRFCKTDLEYSFCLLQSALTTLSNTSQHLSSSWQASHPRSVCLRRNRRTRGCGAMVDKANLIDNRNMRNLEARPPVRCVFWTKPSHGKIIHKHNLLLSKWANRIPTISSVTILCLGRP